MLVYHFIVEYVGEIKLLFFDRHPKDRMEVQNIPHVTTWEAKMPTSESHDTKHV